MEKKKNSKLIALIVLGPLTAFGLISEIVSGIRYSEYYTSGSFLAPAIYIIISVLLLYYAVAGYKKPHGNLLKYLFLLFAVACLCGILMVVAERSLLDTIYNYTRGVVVLITAYVAGRLDRFKQNAVLMSVVGVLMLSTSLMLFLPNIGPDLFGLFTCFTFFILWLDLMTAYLIRYKEHKEAGLADK